MTQSFTLSGAPNFRDLGGYATTSGAIVARHRLYRSDHLASLAPADLAALAARLGESIRVLDLRGSTERESAMCTIPGATVHSLPIEPSIVQKLADLLAAGATVTPDKTVELMQETYRNFVRNNARQFASLFAHVLEDSRHPLVFHCTAGKDRTGFAAALLLLALGVSREVVMQDYLVTNERLANRVPTGALPPQVARVLWSVQPDFLQAALDAVDEQYGGMDNYLREALHLDGAKLERMRALYLQAP